MTLAELLADIVAVDCDLAISGLTLDSRHINVGDLFIALNGAQQHGLEHAAKAIEQGAVAVIYDPEGIEQLPEIDVECVAISRLADVLGTIGAKFYGKPSEKLAVIGITGTNGKTTCSQLIAQALPDCGVIGTLGWVSLDSCCLLLIRPRMHWRCNQCCTSLFGRISKRLLSKFHRMVYSKVGLMPLSLLAQYSPISVATIWTITAVWMST